MAILPSNPSDWKGAIGVFVMHYAAIETEFKLILSAIMDLSIYEFSILSEPYTTQDVRNVMRSMVKHKLPPDQPEREKLIQFVGAFNTFSRLRNQIAHSKWTLGERSGSIKPLGVDIRNGKAKFIGNDPGEKDYTASELVDQCARIGKLYDDLVEFKMKSGYNDIIVRNMHRARYSSD
jgi:hypothetical protein